MPSKYKELRAWESLNDFCISQYASMMKSGVFASPIERAFVFRVGSTGGSFPNYLEKRIDGSIFDGEGEWTFTSNNWNDPILMPLRDLARDGKKCSEHGLVRYYDSEIETHGLLVHADRDFAPYYLMTWYKDRGQTETFERSGTAIRLNQYVELIGDLLDEGVITLDVAEDTDW